MSTLRRYLATRLRWRASPRRAGRVPLAGIAGPQRLCPLRQRRVRAVRRGCRATPRRRAGFSNRACATRGPLRAESALRFPGAERRAGNSAPVSIAILRKQFDKTYVAVTFDNQGRAVTLNFIVVDGPDGWVISDVESPHDSLRCFWRSSGGNFRASDRSPSRRGSSRRPWRGCGRR